jgi:hypothetical protein
MPQLWGPNGGKKLVADDSGVHGNGTYRMRKSSAKGAPRGRAWRISKAQLEALIAGATVDAYNDSEQAAGFFTMMEDNLRVPFETEILGVKVTVERVDLTENDEIVAVCRQDSKRQRISILELPLPSPPPEGVEWIATFRYWKRGGE